MRQRLWTTRRYGLSVAYTLKYHPSVKNEDLPKLDKANAARIRRAIETRLLVAPQDYGEPLRRTLKGYWKLRVGDYRVVFRVKGEEILILGILHRKEVYDNGEGKGDHRHYRNNEHPYDFKGMDALIQDFYKDVEKIRKGEL